MSNLYKIWQNTEGQTLYHVLSAPQKLVTGNLPFLSILIGFLSLNTTIFGNLFCICIFFFFILYSPLLLGMFFAQICCSHAIAFPEAIAHSYSTEVQE